VLNEFKKRPMKTSLQSPSDVTATASFANTPVKIGQPAFKRIFASKTFWGVVFTAVAAIAPIHGTTINSVAQAAPVLRKSLALNSPMTMEQAIQQLALELANRDRAAVGLPPVQVDPLLSQIAQSHARDMLTRNYFSHYSPEGKTPEDRLVAGGGTGVPSENIVIGNNSRFRGINIRLLEGFQDQWMHSSLHRQNILNPNHRKFGYGFAIDPASKRVYAVQVFQHG
jgi:uncharacterized protein YkwD